MVGAVRRAAGSSGKPRITIDVVVEAGEWPASSVLKRYGRQAVDAVVAQLGVRGTAELSIVFSSDDHVRQLNSHWRGKDKPTNVLSFPAFSYTSGDPLPPMLGDIVLAAETVRAEAALEGKPLDHHVTHLLVHGVLHLLGYDHEVEEEAEEMERLERQVLDALAIPDPYA